MTAPVRPAHPQETTGYGVLEMPSNEEWEPVQSIQGFIQPRMHDDFGIKTFACKHHLPIVSNSEHAEKLKV